MDCNFKFLMRRDKGLFLSLKFTPFSSSSCNQKMSQVSVTKWNRNKWIGIYFYTILDKGFFTDEHQNRQLNANIIYYSLFCHLLYVWYLIALNELHLQQERKETKRISVNYIKNIYIYSYLPFSKWICL